MTRFSDNNPDNNPDIDPDIDLDTPTHAQIDAELLAESRHLQSKKKSELTQRIRAWGNLCASISEDLGQSLIAFIPNGLDIIYDGFLKRIPLLGSLFASTWLEEGCKLILGISLGKMLAQEAGRYIFKPMGFIIGAGLGFLLPFYNKPYKGEVGQYLYEISGQTISGALCGLMILFAGLIVQDDITISDLGFYEYGAALMGGALVGLLIKTIMMFAMDALMRSQAASAKLNTQRAQALGQRLKAETKEKVKSSVRRHAKDIIAQMHGDQEGEQLELFFEHKMEAMCEGPHSKIDRHLNYLTDRAIHGDIDALKRLYQLYRRSAQEREKELNKMIDRIINNPRQIQKLKDKIDTLYDKWKFRHYSRSYAGV